MYNEAGETHRCETFEEVYVFEGDGWFHGDKDQKYPRFEDDTDNGDNTEEVTEDKPDREPETSVVEETTSEDPGVQGENVCDVCGKVCKDYRGMVSHKRIAHKEVS